MEGDLDGGLILHLHGLVIAHFGREGGGATQRYQQDQR
jgi:hypothetical protein